MRFAIVMTLSLAFPPGDDEPAFGVAADRIGVAPIYRLNGRPIPAHVAYDAIEKGFDDDGRKLRVTVIGPATLRTKVRSELEGHAAFADLRPQLAIRDLAPDHWALKAGFITTGQPTIYCQTPEGKVLHRQDDFVGGADALVAALRKARETYDPRRDPDLRPRLFGLSNVATLGAASLLGASVSVVLRRRRS